MNAITSGTPRKTGKVKFFETLGWTLRRFKATRKRLIEMGQDHRRQMGHTKNVNAGLLI